ncbi:hypothetical protein MC885_001248 [Smutsia gigantea]|nr:hypothetical protein MC885_001248 [Smutsia gigantea]
MACWAVLALLLGLLGSLVPAQDDTRKSTPVPKKPTTDDDSLNLEDALPGRDHDDPGQPNPPKPKPDPNSKQPGSSDGFSDSDLIGGTSDGGGGGSGGRHSNDPEGQADTPGVVPGIIGAVVVAVAGAISSFIAYQKKKLCFKENANQGELNMENHQSSHAEPPVHRTLLEK